MYSANTHPESRSWVQNGKFLPPRRCFGFGDLVLVFRAMNPVVRGDIVVRDFLNSVGGYRHKARRDQLLDILDVDLDWHMHAISDGERRRVQLVMGLMGEWDVLLLDEVSFPYAFYYCAGNIAGEEGNTDTALTGHC